MTGNFQNMTPELSYVAGISEPFDLTSISLTKGTKKGQVKLTKTAHQLYAPSFVGIPDPGLGAFTERNAAIRAARQFAERNGWDIQMQHVNSRTGEALDVNLAAI